MRKITLQLIALLSMSFGISQTTLTAGDIAFIGSNVDAGSTTDDNATFVLLTDIDAATTLIFTDRGWSDASGFTNLAGDGEVTWTSGIARNAGDIITIDLSFGVLSAGGAYAIQGDQLFAIQGSIASPNFIAGLHFNVEPTGGTNPTTTNDSNWDGTSTNNDESELPNALINGDTAVRLTGVDGAEQDNFQFSCALAGSNPVSGTPAQIRAILHNRNNWNFNNATGYNPPAEAGCSITVMSAADTTPPVITCAATPAPIIAGINGMATVPNLVTGSSATDDVSSPGNINITQSPTAGTMIGVGVTVVSVFATDEAGNTDSCTINVTVNEPPSTVLVAGDIAFVGFNLDGTDGFAFIILKDIIAGTNIKLTDCGVNNPNTISCTSGDSTNTWYAPSAMTAGTIVSLDGSFFASPLASQGDQILAFQGTVASPVFIAAIHSNIEAGITNDADWDGAALNNDESALPNQLINGTNAIRLHASETEVDNWQFDCSLVPGGLPITGNATTISAIINDIQYWINSDTVEFNPAAASGCTYNVILDNVPPEAVCMDITVQLDATGNATISADNVDSGSSDNSGTVTISVSQTSFTCADTMDPVIVTLTATDPAGNAATCTAEVTVEDNVNPIATCATAFTVQLDATGMASITVADIDNGSTDACGIASTSIDMTDFTCADVGVNSVTLTVTDLNGNVSTCTTDVTVEDNVSPTAMCAAPFTLQLDASGMASISVADIDNGSTDACGIASASIDMTDFTCADVGVNTVTLTVTDVNGNVSTCTTDVTVEDNVVPTAMCVDSFTLQLDTNGTASISVVDIDNGSTSACGIASVSIDMTDFTCEDVGVNLVTLTVTDVNGNVSTCTTDVTVEDDLAPVISCPSDQTEAVNDGEQFTMPDYFSTGGAIAVDNCTDTVNITTQNPAVGTLLDLGVYTVTLTAEDDFGNMVTCTFELTVDDVLGINNENFDITTLVMYPNPATNHILLSNPKNIPLKNVSIYDITGRLIKIVDASQTTSDLKIDISELASATYVILINTKVGKMTKQLIKINR